MDKFLISDFNFCDKFLDKIRREFFKQGEGGGNFSYGHNVSCGSLTIFLGYFKENFDINVFVEKVTDLAEKRDLCSYGWKVRCFLVNKGRNRKFSEIDPDSEVLITLIAV